MQIKLRDLATARDGRICFDYTIDLQKEEVNFSHPFEEPVRLVGEVRDNAGVISLDSEVEAVVHTRCARCNRPVTYEKYVPVQFILAKTVSKENEDRDDILVVEGDTVELDDIMVPELIMDMEMAVVCTEDCKGLCPKCGKDLNEGECGCNRKEVDPRLAPLAKLLEQLKNEENNK